MDEIVIIGTGPAAVSALGAYRHAGGEAGVTLIGAEQERPYSRPHLSKEFMRGDVGRDEFRLEVSGEHTLLLGAAVVELRPGTVVLADGRKLHPAQCLLASGAQPLRPPIPGAEDPDVLTLRSLADAERISRRGARSVVIIGSGFIGCELAVSLRIASGAEVSLVSDEELPQQRRLGDAAATRIASWLREAGVQFLGGRRVESISDARTVDLERGERRRAELIVLATGSAPRGELAADYGAEMHDGAVRVDGAMRADPFLLAAGDVAFAHNTAAARALRVEHWGEALRQGEIAGRTLAGVRDRWDNVPGFWTTIGRRTLKYRAWGDGYDESELVEHGDAWTVWYRRAGVCVGVLTYERDEDYERAAELVVA